MITIVRRRILLLPEVLNALSRIRQAEFRFVGKMAAAPYQYHSLPKLSATNRVLRSEGRGRSDPSVLSAQSLTPKSLKTSWLGSNVWVQPCTLRFHVSGLKRRPLAATVSCSLPTANPERVSSGQNVPKWSSNAIKSFSMAELEARKLKYPTTGTEALLMGILVEGTNLAAKFLRANGFTLLKVRDETVKLLGKADMYFFSPGRPPLTEEAQRALDWAVDQKIKSGDGGEITTTHILLGIWSEVESPGHKIMSTLGFNDEKATELESLICKPGFTDD